MTSKPRQQAKGVRYEVRTRTRGASFIQKTSLTIIALAVAIAPPSYLVSWVKTVDVSLAELKAAQRSSSELIAEKLDNRDGRIDRNTADIQTLSTRVDRLEARIPSTPAGHSR